MSVGTSGHARAFESLEERMLLSKVGPLVNAGDESWNEYASVSQNLVRASDIVVVGFEPSSARRIRRLSAALTEKSGALAGYQVRQTLDSGTVLFKRTARGPAPGMEVLQEKMVGVPAIRHLSPTFFTLPDWRRIVALDSLYVQFKTEVSPTAVLGKAFRQDWAATGGNGFVVRLKQGGAVESLRAATRLRSNPKVNRVVATVAVEAVRGGSNVPSGTFVKHGGLASAADAGRTSPVEPLVIGGIGDYGMDMGEGAQTDDPTLVVRGYGPVDCAVTLYLDGKAVGWEYVDDNGLWTIDASTMPLSPGNHTLIARGWDLTSAPFHVRLVDAAIQAPWITEFEDSDGMHWGVCNRVSTRQWSVQGRGAPGTWVIVRGSSGRVSDVAAVVGPEGRWTVQYDAGPATSFNAEDLVAEQVQETGEPLEGTMRQFSYVYRILRDEWNPQFTRGWLYPYDDGFDSIAVEFSEPVLGYELENFELLRDDVLIPWDAQEMNVNDLDKWVIEGTANLLRQAGSYELRRVAGAETIRDLTGNLLVGELPSARFRIT